MARALTLWIAIADGEHARFVQPDSDNAPRTLSAFVPRQPICGRTILAQTDQAVPLKAPPRPTTRSAKSLIHTG